MTTTTINHNPPVPASTRNTRPPIRRLNRLVLGGAFALAAVGGTVALVALSGSDGQTAATVERSGPAAPAAASMSADAAERWATAEAEAYERLASIEAAEREAQRKLSAEAFDPSSVPATSTVSADALDRQHQIELSRRAAMCRSGVVAPDAIERCISRQGA